jgi:hypothetical protein
MNLIEYFAVIDEDGLRRGPFETMEEATRFLKDIAMDRGYTDEQADQLFLHGSAVVKVETINGKVDIFNLGWPAREESSSQELPTEIRVALPEMVMAKAPLRGKPK